MEHTYDELKHKNVDQLREIAAEVGLTGYTQKNKDHLLQEICEKLGLEMRHIIEIKGIDKAAVKAKIREIKVKRQAALEAKDTAGLKLARKRIRRLKRKMRRAMVISS